jgi:hypothetical protein
MEKKTKALQLEIMELGFSIVKKSQSINRHILDEMYFTAEINSADVKKDVIKLMKLLKKIQQLNSIENTIKTTGTVR